jgi:hypothetical protein
MNAAGEFRIVLEKVAVMLINVPFTRNSPSELGSPR